MAAQNSNTASAPQVQLPPVVTSNARKYGTGPPTVHVQGNSITIKSGLTPIAPLPQVPPNRADQQRILDTENYQKQTLRGFTTQELVDLEVISYNNLPFYSLDVPIHQIFAQSRWTAFPRKNVYLPGTSIPWSAQSNLVWPALQPCLRLATQILSHLNTHPWFDAMMLGPRNDVEHHSLSPATLLKGTAIQQNLKTFHLRLPGPNNPKECQAMIDTLLNLPPLNDITFGIMSGAVHPILATTPQDFSTDAYTLHGYRSSRGPRLRIFVACELLSPLLRSDLNDGERLGQQFLIATTMVHELMHAINKNKVHEDLRRTRQGQRPGGLDWQEPYFMDEQDHELGFSAENAIFNGRFAPLRKFPMEGPHPGFCLASFPDIDVAMVPDEILIQPPLPNFQTSIPVQLDYLRDIFSKSFWDLHVKSIRDVKPKPVVAASWKFTMESMQEWKVLNQSMIVAALAPIASSAAIDRLLGLRPIERTAAGKRIRQARVDEFKRDSQTSHSIVGDLMHQGIMCERRRGTPEYVSAVELLLRYLDALIATQRNLLNTMVNLEQLGDDITVPKLYLYRRNREIKRFISHYLANGPESVDHTARLQGHLLALVIMRAPFTKTAANPAGINDAEEQRQIQDSDDADDRLFNDLATLAQSAVAGDRALCKTNCELLKDSLGCKVLIKCRASIMLGVVDIPSSVQHRRTLVQTGLRGLNELTIAPVEVADVDLYKAIAAAVLQNLDNEEQNQGNILWTSRTIPEC